MCGTRDRCTAPCLQTQRMGSPYLLRSDRFPQSLRLSASHGAAEGNAKTQSAGATGSGIPARSKKNPNDFHSRKLGDRNNPCWGRPPARLFGFSGVIFGGFSKLVWTPYTNSGGVEGTASRRTSAGCLTWHGPTTHGCSEKYRVRLVACSGIQPCSGAHHRIAYPVGQVHNCRHSRGTTRPAGSGRQRTRTGGNAGLAAGQSCGRVRELPETLGGINPDRREYRGEWEATRRK